MQLCSAVCKRSKRGKKGWRLKAVGGYRVTELCTRLVRRGRGERGSQKISECNRVERRKKRGGGGEETLPAPSKDALYCLRSAGTGKERERGRGLFD